MIRASLLWGTAATLAATLVGTDATAQTESRVSADVSATAGYSHNPYTLQGNETGSPLVSLDIAPRYQLLTPKSTITVSADADIQQYLHRYGNNVNYSGALDYQGRPSERITAHARIDLSTAVLGSSNNYLPLANSAGTGIPGTGGSGTGATDTTVGAGLEPITGATPLTPYTDVGLYGLRDRRRSAQASGNIGFTLSARDSLNVNAFAGLARYSGLVGSDYEDYGGGIGYQRRLSSRLSLGLSGAVSTYDYHTTFPSSQTYSIEATSSVTLSDRWKADGALGVSFIEGGGAGSARNTSLAGNLDLCRQGAYSSLCLQAARQASPTGYVGTQYVTSVGLSWNRQLDERQNVSLSADYSKVGGGQTLIVGGLPLETEYLQSTATYSRQLRSRLKFVASANYRDLLGNNGGHTADYGGQIGLSYRFGDRH